MAGNTRGKLKEHFEGVHRNFDWCGHHIASSLVLIASQLRETNAAAESPLDEKAMDGHIEKYPLIVGIKALGDGIATLDELAQGIYTTL